MWLEAAWCLRPMRASGQGPSQVRLGAQPGQGQHEGLGRKRQGGHDASAIFPDHEQVLPQGRTAAEGPTSSATQKRTGGKGDGGGRALARLRRTPFSEGGREC